MKGSLRGEEGFTEAQAKGKVGTKIRLRHEPHPIPKGSIATILEVRPYRGSPTRYDFTVQWEIPAPIAETRLAHYVLMQADYERYFEELANTQQASSLIFRGLRHMLGNLRERFTRTRRASWSKRG